MPVIVVQGLVNPVSLAPTLLTPANGTYLDLSGTPTFTWQYNAGQTGLTQSAYAFLRIVNGGALAQFWNAGTATWQSTPVYNSGTTTLANPVFSLTFPTSTVTTNANMASTAATAITSLTVTAGTGTNFTAPGGVTVVTSVGIATYTVTAVAANALTVTFVSQTGGTGYVTTGLVTQSQGSWQAWQDGNVYQWSVQTQDSNGTGALAGYFTLNAQSAPSVTVTAPSGTISTADPLVTWTTVLAPGAQQTSYRVVIFNSTQYGTIANTPATLSGVFTTSAGATVPSVYDSGQQGGSYTFSLDLSTVPLYLLDSTSYRAYVAVTETGGQLSPWAYSAFATSYTAPTTPTVTAVASTDSVTGCPLINVTVTGATFSGTQRAFILRAGSDGSSVYVRNASIANPATLAGGTPHILVPDYEVTPGVTYTYAAQIVVITGTNASVVSGVGTSTPAVSVPTGAGWWELDPLNPSTAVHAQAINWQAQVTEQSTAHVVTGQSVPNIVSNAMGGLDGNATFETFDQPTFIALQTLLQSQATIFVSSPFGSSDTGYVRFGPQTGGMSSGSGNTVKASDLLPSSVASMHRTTAITWVAQFRPAV